MCDTISTFRRPANEIPAKERNSMYKGTHPMTNKQRILMQWKKKTRPCQGGAA